MLLTVGADVGIVRLTIHQAKELDHTKSLSGELNPIGKIIAGGHVHKTNVVKHSNNPVWESSTEFLCADRASSVVAVQIIDDRDFLKDPTVGFLSIKLEDLLEAKKEAGRDWWPLSQCKSGKVRLSVEWKPLQLPGSLAGAGQYTPPIGVVRLWLQKATDVKNVEATLGGKVSGLCVVGTSRADVLQSDPYVRVQVGGVTRGRTEVINNSTLPNGPRAMSS